MASDRMAHEKLDEGIKGFSKAIETLKKALAKNPKSSAAPKQKFFVAQCYEKLGNSAEARNYYGQIVNDHPKSDFAVKAKTKLSQIATAK